MNYFPSVQTEKHFALAESRRGHTGLHHSSFESLLPRLPFAQIKENRRGLLRKSEVQLGTIHYSDRGYSQDASGGADSD